MTEQDVLRAKLANIEARTKSALALAALLDELTQLAKSARIALDEAARQNRKG